MSNFLFNEFEPVSAKEWKQKIQVDLKGADYNETLLWKTNEGITVKPFYHNDEYVSLTTETNVKKFSICQSVFVDNEKTANKLVIDALNRGATAIQFEANEPFNIEILLENVIASGAKQSLQLYFKFNFLSLDFINELLEKTKNRKIFLNIDPIGNLAKSGNWFTQSKEKDFDILKNILLKTSENVSVLAVDVSLYQNAGATMVQQVAYALAHVNEYFNFILNDNVTSSAVEKPIQFNFAVGSNYFFEIAKLRAFRYLFSLLCQEYNFNTESHIFTTPSLRNKTLYDYNVNLLRTTTECMSAILGGSDVVSNAAYDSFFHKSNEFGERIARNQLLILQNESYLNEASQIADGSYYIEALTEQIAEKALAIFKDIEKTGGFVKQLIEGTIQRKIEESAQKEQEQFNNGELILLGTNKHPNLEDKMKNELELYPFLKIKPRKTSIKPIVPKRLAEQMEQERLKTE